MQGTSYFYAILLLPAFCRAESFNYEDQSSWGGMCNNGTKMQSPVDINTNLLTRFIKLTPLQFDNAWSTPSWGNVSNNGATVMFNPNTPPQLEIGFLGNYSLGIVHFHWGPNGKTGSEHRIDGRQADMEIHFGAFKKYANKEDRDYVAVLGVLADVDNNPISGVWEKINVAAVQQTGSMPINATGVVVSDLLPSDRSYYYYEGSFTTPPCSEIVQWFVMKNRITVPSAFLSQLRMVQDKSGRTLSSNVRLAQPLNDRLIVMEGSQVIHRPTLLIILFAALIVKFVI